MGEKGEEGGGRVYLFGISIEYWLGIAEYCSDLVLLSIAEHYCKIVLTINGLTMAV